MDTFKDLFGKTVHVRRKIKLFMDYHMSQKTKWIYYVIKYKCGLNKRVQKIASNLDGFVILL